MGAELVSNHGYEGLSEQVIANAKWDGNRDLVIDGIRHVDVLEAIKRNVTPTPVLLIYLQLDSQPELDSRAEHRGITPLSRPKLEAKSTERDVIEALPAVADIVVSAEQPMDQIVLKINALLETLGAAP